MSFHTPQFRGVASHWWRCYFGKIMQLLTLSSIQAMREASAPQKITAQFLPLEDVKKPNLTTAECAFYLNRRPQTLRGWACLENGPIRPHRISGMLAWSTAEVRALACIASGEKEASK